ncbi:hypothetical protein SAMN02787144_1009171 [Streptomyces atratus]|uniref:Uncharacterized protein n=1 Tax=Streptomyces atratus TaxID=1893 RepID=A0A1K2BW68_STRAR|nr:hypothetical protein [Streptomyces atratus]SFY02380.1 hypothetical protein SAMN02787144_1009171 [Streptomyces atratus]
MTGLPYRPEPFAAAVTGIGMVTAAGIGAEASWRTVCEVSTAPSVPHRPELHGLPGTGGADPLPPGIGRCATGRIPPADRPACRRWSSRASTTR